MGLVKIAIPAVTYQQFESGQIDIIKLFDTVCLVPENYHNILTQLQNYHSDEDGAPTVPQLMISDVAYNPVGQNGKVRLSYFVDFTFACADKRATTRHTETSDFNIDKAGSMLMLNIHDKITRSTRDEF